MNAQRSRRLNHSLPPNLVSSGAAIAAAFLVAVALSICDSASAQQAAPTGPQAAPSATAPAVSEQADRMLKEVGAYIGSAQEFTFHADITFDHVLPSGQKLQYAASEDVALRRPGVLVDRAPEIVLLAIDPEKHLIEVPGIARAWAAPEQLTSKVLAELQAPAPDALVRDDHAPFGQQRLNIPQAQAEHTVQPYSMGDDLGREAVPAVRVG